MSSSSDPEVKTARARRARALDADLEQAFAFDPKGAFTSTFKRVARAETLTRLNGTGDVARLRELGNALGALDALRYAMGLLKPELCRDEFDRLQAACAGKAERIARAAGV